MIEKHVIKVFFLFHTKLFVFLTCLLIHFKKLKIKKPIFSLYFDF